MTISHFFIDSHICVVVAITLSPSNYDLIVFSTVQYDKMKDMNHT